jgi:hypothetical protein
MGGRFLASLGIIPPNEVTQIHVRFHVLFGPKGGARISKARQYEGPRISKS